MDAIHQSQDTCEVNILFEILIQFTETRSMRNRGQPFHCRRRSALETFPDNLTQFENYRRKLPMVSFS